MTTPSELTFSALHGDAIFHIDLEAKVTFANDEVLSQWGRPRGEVLGRALSTLFPETLTSGGFERLQRALVSQRPDQFETFSRLLGHAIDTALYPTGVGLTVVFRDARDRLQTERTLGVQADLLSLAQDAVFVRDRGGRITFWNPAASTLYGYTAEEAYGQNAHAMLQTVFPVSREETDEALVTTGHWDGELGHRTKAGRLVTVWSRQALRLGLEGAPDTILETNRDVTAERRILSRLQTLSEVGLTLGRSLDPAVTLEEVARLCVQDLADWVLIDVLGEDGAPRRMAATHRDPVKRALAHSMLRWQPNFEVPNAISVVLEHGEPVRIDTVTDDMVTHGTYDEENRATVRALAPQSFLIVPLRVGERNIGALTLVRSQPGEPFDDADLAFALEIARRSAVALDHARTHAAKETASRQLAEEGERLARILDQLPVAVWLAEVPSGRLLAGNRAIAQVLREPFRPVETIEEYGTYVGFHPDGRPVAPHEWPLARTVTSGEPNPGEDFELRRGDGTHGVVRFTSALIHDDAGRPTQAVVAGLDVTDLRAAERDLRALNDTLETRVQARTAELSAANRQLESFSYSVSHDLRTPLRHILGFTAILRRATQDGSFDGRAAHLLGVIETAANRMNTLIDELLGFSRLSMQVLRLEPCDLAGLIMEVRQELAPDTEGRQVTWTLGRLPTVQADGRLLHLALSNLLSNALKYTGGREVAQIEIGGEATDDEWIIWIRDNGAGFDPAYADRLFGVFQRLHTDREFEGVGIGLANVRQIIERHGGRIWAEGVPGRGATFTFSLPRGPGAGIASSGS